MERDANHYTCICGDTQHTPLLIVSVPLSLSQMPCLCIKRPLQLHHVGMLLWVDVVVWEVHQEPVNIQPKQNTGWSLGGQTAFHAKGYIHGDRCNSSLHD